MKRIRVIDNCKFIAILLVVIGHLSMPEWCMRFIYSFHMPLFFFLSGCLISEKIKRNSITKNIHNSFKQYILPYILFSVCLLLHYVIYSFFSKYGNLSIDWKLIMGSFFCGNLSALWFLTCLFFSVLYYSIASTIVKNEIVLLLLFMFSAVISSIVFANSIGIFSIPVSMIAVFYFTLGGFFRPFILRLENYDKNKILFIILSIIFIVTTLVLAPINGLFAMAEMCMGNYIALFIPISFLGISTTFICAKLIPENRIINWISQNTLTIFGLQFIFISWTKAIFRFAFSVSYPPKDNEMLVIMNITCLILVLVLSYFAKIILHRLFPSIIK